MHRVGGWWNDLITGIKRESGGWQKGKLRHRISLESFNTTLQIQYLWKFPPLNLNICLDLWDQQFGSTSKDAFKIVYHSEGFKKHHNRNQMWVTWCRWEVKERRLHCVWHPWDSVSAVLKSGILCRESIEPRRPAIHYTFYRWQPSHLVGLLNGPSNCFGLPATSLH